MHSYNVCLMCMYIYIYIYTHTHTLPVLEDLQAHHPQELREAQEAHEPQYLYDNHICLTCACMYIHI